MISWGGGLKVKARRYALGFFMVGMARLFHYLVGGGLKVKAHRRCAAHRSFFMRVRSNCVWSRRIKKARRLRVGPFFWSGWRDSNSRPLAPHASALPGCATSRFFTLVIQQNPGG